MRACLFAATAALIFTSSAFSQWLKYPTPGIPRLSDGKPNLKAPAPKGLDGKPDLSGIWSANAEGYGLNLVSDLKPDEIQPWAAAIAQTRSENLGIDHPQVRCLPGIGPEITLGGFKLLQTPSTLGFLSEAGFYRQVLTDGRPLPTDPNPTWQGYSIGHWEGDTMVIESAGFNDRSWLDFAGHPHTEALRVTERFHRTDFGHMDIQITYEDRKAYARPWTIDLKAELTVDTELLEYVCNENERDAQHFLVTDEDRKKSRTEVKVAASILSSYTGVYQMVNHDGKPIDRMGQPLQPGDKPEPFSIVLNDGQLALQMPGAGKMPLKAESESIFSIAGTPVEFVKDANGTVTHLMIRSVEGEVKGVRQGDVP